MDFDTYELILNHITAGEHRLLFKDPEAYEDYMQTAYLFLNHKGKHLFEEDILSHYGEGVTLEKLFNQNSKRFLPSPNQVKNGKREKAWYDIWDNEEIERNDDFFDYFFICKLRHLSLLDIDSFLFFHLGYSFKNNKQEYFRFLKLAMRQHERLLDAKITDTVNEWMNVSQISDNQSTELSETNKKNSNKNITARRPKVKREPNDNVTSLNLAQTAYLAILLKQSNIAIKDNVVLTEASTGAAFHILTGYSEDTLRLKMNLKGQNELTYQDYVKVRNILYDIVVLIDKEIGNQRGKK